MTEEDDLPPEVRNARVVTPHAQAAPTTSASPAPAAPAKVIEVKPNVVTRVISGVTSGIKNKIQEREKNAKEYAQWRDEVKREGETIRREESKKGYLEGIREKGYKQGYGVATKPKEGRLQKLQKVAKEINQNFGNVQASSAFGSTASAAPGHVAPTPRPSTSPAQEFGNFSSESLLGGTNWGRPRPREDVAAGAVVEKIEFRKGRRIVTYKERPRERPKEQPRGFNINDY